MRYVIYSETEGVYLGSFLGLGFWSKLDPADQLSAATFKSEADAEAYMTTHAPNLPFRVVPVEPDDGKYATPAACEAAGLPGWKV